MPREVRELLELRSGEPVAFEVGKDGRVTVRPWTSEDGPANVLPLEGRPNP